MPLEVCGAVVKHELDYWQINENHIKSCCWRNYRSYIEDQRILDSFNRSVLKQNLCKYVDESLHGWQRFRENVWMILEYPRTSNVAMVSFFTLALISNSYTMGCPPVRGDNPRALASGLSYVQVDKHGITILYH